MSLLTAAENNIDAFSIVCRGCLAQRDDMKNMYEWGLAEDFSLLTEVILIRTEGTTELLCSDCEEALINCKKFKMQCHSSDAVLKDLKQMKSPKKDPIKESYQEVIIKNKMTNNTLTVYVTTGNTESKIYFTCPYKCSETFLKQNKLFSHICLVHKVEKSIFNIEVKFQCPYKDCKYNISKHFIGRKYLNQHLNKRHSSETIVCEECKIPFRRATDYKRHLKTCNFMFECNVCSLKYITHERLLVHILRKHPDIHKQYKNIKKRKSEVTETITREEPIKKDKKEVYNLWDSPKRSFATQTFPLEAVKNDVSLSFWQDNDRNFINTETQTVFEDMLSLRSQNSDEDFLFSETVSLSDIQTQTFQDEISLSRRTCETQTRDYTDWSIKETQTCFCHFDSPRMNFKLFDSANSSPGSLSLTTAETQTNIKTDVMLSQSCAETQTIDDNSTSCL